jgi:tRNA pseudouridine synthase 8/2,5-diamino-6-(5-phospho-D-ribitylamino)-pyrimidin-4(3H)-one deaminase
MNDKIEHKAEKKEPGVFDYKLDIIFEDDNYLVINKPPSIPVHVCGNYLYNTIISILKFEYKID